MESFMAFFEPANLLSVFVAVIVFATVVTLITPILYRDKLTDRMKSVSSRRDELRRLADSLCGLPLSFDLADLRGYHYHSGIVFAAYCQGSPAAVAHGGRYDRVGKAFGRGRPATGFSIDLRELVRSGVRRGEAT